MNAADRKEFELIHNKIDNIKSDIDEMKTEMSKAHGKNRRISEVYERKPI